MMQGEGMPNFNIFFFFFFFLGGGVFDIQARDFKHFYLSSFIFDIKHKCFNILLGNAKNSHIIIK